MGLAGGPGDVITTGAPVDDGSVVVVCPGVASAEEARGIADRVADLLREDVALSVGTLPASASVGIAFTTGSTVSGDALVARADAAMYESKRCGGGRATLLP